MATYIGGTDGSTDIESTVRYEQKEGLGLGNSQGLKKGKVYSVPSGNRNCFGKTKRKKIFEIILIVPLRTSTIRGSLE